MTKVPTVKDALVKGREIIADPANWKQGGLAEQEDGKVTGPFCSLGAIGKACKIFAITQGTTARTGEVIGFSFGGFYEEANSRNTDAHKVYSEARDLLAECLPAPVHEYNDTHSHECVMAAFDAAIERCES